jgi:hypothetical protein
LTYGISASFKFAALRAASLAALEIAEDLLASLLLATGVDVTFVDFGSTERFDCCKAKVLTAPWSVTLMPTRPEFPSGALTTLPVSPLYWADLRPSIRTFAPTWKTFGGDAEDEVEVDDDAEDDGEDECDVEDVVDDDDDDDEDLESCCLGADVFLLVNRACCKQMQTLVPAHAIVR